MRNFVRNRFKPNSNCDLASMKMLFLSLAEMAAATGDQKAADDWMKTVNERNALRAEVVRLREVNAEFLEALLRALEDMGSDGHCVCQAVKQQMLYAIAKAKARIMSEQKLKDQMGAEAKKIACEKFCAKKIVPQYLDFYCLMLK